ncbi:dynein axonemal assembly factor 5 [Nothobranchius furzeri]|uniref:Dynein (Axonemal) assembly factor 5 n=2 Tax=Nothobranchius TaxID=28779 RepID=A0A1A7ZL32_NOTFU|nr:dynein axonemal assembly factor 5 [Nothobranchius furzeri]KAF7220950.1 dynein (axonemal) assembly factor 5 [Nothobranchius furzeri]
MAAEKTGDKHAASDVLRGLHRHLNCLNEDNKMTRRRALELIKKETVDKGLCSGVLQEILSSLLKPLLKSLSDPVERCRETALVTITDFIRCVPRPEESLSYLMPCLAQRFGEKETLEPSEELRLLAVELLTLTVEVCGKHLAPYLNEMINILQRTIVDPFPDVKRESCKCVVSFAKCVPEHFHMQAESLVKPLMQTITHQHSRVRVSVVEATGAVIQHGSGKNVDDVLSHLAQRLFDDSPQVRKAVAAVVGGWLLNMRDRYSYFHKLIPLLLSSTTDEIPEIRLLAADLWKQVGAQWEQENEDDIKDKMDFLLTPPLHYPPGVERPGLGCRELVVRNLGRLVPAISHDVTDWLVPTRVRTSQLLSVLLLHAEDHTTQHLQPLLATLYRACADSERDVVNNCLAAANLMGTFVPPPVFLKLLLDHVTSPYSSSHPWPPLMVLAAVLGGCSRELLKPHLQQIANTLVQPAVCQEYQQVMYLEQLLACVTVLLNQCESECGSVSLQLLQVLVTVQSLSTEPQLSAKAMESTHSLSKVQGLDSTELYRRHMRQLLDWLSASVNTWTSYSPQRLQLQIIVMQSGPVIGEFVSQLMPLLHSCLQPDKDTEMRMMIFTMLAKLLLDANNTLDSKGHFREESEKFVCDILLPNLVWRAGRTAGAVRTSALSCLLALLHGGSITAGQLLCLEEQLSPRVFSALEEDSQTSRLFACRSLSAMLGLIGTSLHHEALNKIYPELLKRLDDSSEEVRGIALQAVGLWLSSLTTDYNPELCAPHLQLLFQQLLLHLDDPNSSVQDQVLEILKKGSSVHPALLRREAEAVRDKHRSPVRCDLLLQHISSLPTETSPE